MHRRTFVSTSLLVAGATVTWPLCPLVGKHSIANEVRKLQAFTSTKPWDFGAASDYLASLGHQRFALLRAALRNGSDDTCCLAACLAKRMAQDALPLLPELIALVQDDHCPNWFRAVIAIGQIGEPAQAAVIALERRLEHSNPLMQLDVVNSLIHIQPSRLDELSNFLHSALDQFELAFPACRIVGELEQRGGRFLPQLKSLVIDHATVARPEIRYAAARAVYKITNNKKGDTQVVEEANNLLR